MSKNSFIFRYEINEQDINEEPYKVPEADNLTDTYIDYFFLPGSVWIIHNGIELHFEWVPLLSFVYNISTITTSLGAKPTGSGSYEFTESDDVLEINKSHNTISISDSYSGIVLSGDFNDFHEGITSLHATISATAFLPAELSDKLNKYLYAE